MNGFQCDTCRTFTASPDGWLLLAQHRAAADHPLASLLGGGGGPELSGTFCTIRCLAEWAYVRLATDRTAGTSLPGTEGWIG